jgi:hypothetical protein
LTVHTHDPLWQVQRSRAAKHGRCSQVVAMPAAAVAALTQSSPPQPAVAQPASALHSPAEEGPSTRSTQPAYIARGSGPPASDGGAA